MGITVLFVDFEAIVAQVALFALVVQWIEQGTPNA